MHPVFKKLCWRILLLMILKVKIKKIGTMIKSFVLVSFAVLLFWGCSKNSGDTGRVTPPTDTTATFDGQIISDIVYGSNKDYLGNNVTLALDIYLPKEASTTKLPFIMYIHGGSFLVGDKEASKSDCKILASAGFVTATINYRLGWTDNEPSKCDADTGKLAAAWYRAQQDTRAALRYLIANASKYSIDTNWIFIEGASAGAEAALGAAYFPQDSADFYLGGIVDTLGPLDNAGNKLTNTYSIKGVGSMWGAINSPYLISPQNAVPTIFFHGGEDPTVPYDIGHYFSCDNFPIGYGTKVLYDRLNSFGISTVAYVDPTAGHGIYDDQFNEPNIACFFKSVMANEKQNGFYTTKVSICK